MAHFARIDENNIVTTVLVVPDEQQHRGEIYLNELGLDGRWLQTSYNTIAGVHYGPNLVPDGRPALRKNYAGIGFTYDEVRDAFVPPKPLEGIFGFDEDKCIWVRPGRNPDEPVPYEWDPIDHTWKAVVESGDSPAQDK